jgi:hypothetical protein
MTSNSRDVHDQEQPGRKTDPIATLLLLAFAASLMYLLIASTLGIYPWFAVMDQIYFVPTWEAAITFLAIATIMFVTLIGGLVKMRYSIILVGLVALIAIFTLTFFVMLFIAGFGTPLSP